MARQITLDVETQRLFDEVGNDSSKLGISYVGVHDSLDDRYFGFFEHELGQLWPILEQADLVIGFNIKHFDYAVLAPYYSGDLNKFPTIDLLEIVKIRLGFRLKLDSLAKGTLKKGKLGSGLDAVKYFREGKLEELAKYCLEDVKITREIFDYAREKGKLFYPDLGGATREFDVNIDDFMPVAADETQLTFGI